jgi:hypothetical protein
VLAEPWQVVDEAVNQVEGRTAISAPQSKFQGLRISVHFFSGFNHWYFDNHFQLVIFKTILVKVTALVVAILRIT